MILAWIIYDSIKWEKICKEKGWNPAVTLSERLQAYFLLIVLPIFLAIVKCYLD